jgi:hypothetical protein
MPSSTRRSALGTERTWRDGRHESSVIGPTADVEQSSLPLVLLDPRWRVGSDDCDRYPDSTALVSRAV